ncbi:DUF1349 domain-containing protein [Flagellimonas marina]|uniref:DUF1349 domain-containing protein n=1 Tax=Flagellimonas marina TaxID=1775168 RepID=A0ABV8PPY0_9FLAO
MRWYNDPTKWKFIDKTLEFQVTPKTDYWQKTSYGFCVDDGSFYYRECGGEFEVNVKLTADYRSRYDQAGLMLRLDHENWVKTGIEFVDGIFYFSTVLTHGHSNWSLVPIKEKFESIWIKGIKRKDSFEIHYSMNGKGFQMASLVHMPKQGDMKIGMMAASTDGNGFVV